MLTANEKMRNAIVEASRRFGYRSPIGLMAVIEVESAGRAFWTIKGKQLPPMRPEGHYFYRLLDGDKRQRAVSEGLAWPKYSPELAPRTWTASYEVFARMEKVDKDVAIMSCSWGLGQVMGSDFSKLGYPNAVAFYDAQMTLDGQIDTMLRYIRANRGMSKKLTNGGTTAESWRPFAHAYNGPAYARLGYHEKMARAFRKYSNAAAGLGLPRAEIIDDSDQIKDIQKRLAKIGYWKNAVDGLDTPNLRAQIKKFQQTNGLAADGVYGPLTARAVDEAGAKADKENAQKLIRLGGGTTGVSAVGEQIVSQATPLRDFGGPVLTWAITALIVAGLALILWGLYRKYQLDNAEIAEAKAEEEDAFFARADIEEASTEDHGAGFAELNTEDVNQ